MNSTVHATAQKRAPVTTAALIAKAIELIETAGLEALSMRRLGEAFGIQAASVYWYVASKDNLLDLVADELNRQAAAYLTARKRPCQTGTLQLTHLGYLYRSFLYAHPQSELLLAARLPAGPNRVDLIGAFVADLITCHAVPGETAVAAAAAVRAFTHGFVIEQNARRAVIDQHGQAVEASHAEFQSRMASTGQAGGDRQRAGTPSYELLAQPSEFDLPLQAIVAGMLGHDTAASNSANDAERVLA